MRDNEKAIPEEDIHLNHSDKTPLNYSKKKANSYCETKEDE